MNQSINFIWGGDRAKRNTRLKFYIELEKKCDTLELCGADFFQVYANGKFLCYGPERTAAGYARKAKISVKGVNCLAIYVNAYNVNSYAFDLQKPFFGARILYKDEVVYNSNDFICFEENKRVEKVPRHSMQRGYIEVCDYTRKGDKEVPIYEVESPIIIEGIGDNSSYERCGFTFFDSYAFNGIKEKVSEHSWYYRDVWEGREFEYDRDFVEKVEKGFTAYDFRLDRERTGFIGLKIKSKAGSEIFVRHEEYLIDGSWDSDRTSTCRNLISIKTDEEEVDFLSAEPYAFKYLLILVKGDAEIEPYFIALENKNAKSVNITGNEKFVEVFEAARHTFEQNALDVYMDCPGRERAGWLCDSYFTAFSERLFTGDNKIEKSFLENIILSNTEELPEGMLPKCFPSQHTGGLYIPNWALWFIVELESYFERTSDYSLIEKAKDKVYGVIKFFEDFENEYGLLEGLKSWVFIEWSVCNDREYIKGVNFPSNMLYAKALDVVSSLYGDMPKKEKAQQIRNKIYEFSFNGKFYIDNAIRDENNNLVCCSDHVSETCQYYALFFGLKADENFVKIMKDEFGPFREKGSYPNVGRSNMFIGNYLRLFWLCSVGEHEKVILESLEYFLAMAKKTGTLWEHDRPGSSCNHGFASSIAPIMLRCLCGYITVKDSMPVFDEQINSNSEKYGITIDFNYKK